MAGGQEAKLVEIQKVKQARFWKVDPAGKQKAGRNRHQVTKQAGNPEVDQNEILEVKPA